MTVEMTDDPYRIRNNELFAQRIELKQRLALLEQSDIDHPAVKREARVLKRAVDVVTEQIVEFNRGLVRAYCGRFTSTSSRSDAEDFMSAGMLGLMRAIDTYDPAQGKFSSWAFPPIRREVLRAVRQADHPTVNTSDFERRPEILKAYRTLKGSDEQPDPTHEEVAAVVGARPDQVARVLHPVTLESADRSSGTRQGLEHVASDAVGPDAQVVSALTVRALWAHGLGALDDRERYVLCRRFGLDGEPEERLADLGVTLNLSREAVRQIEAKALAKMQHPLVLKKISRHDDAAPRTSARLRSPGERMHRVLESVG